MELSRMILATSLGAAASIGPLAHGAEGPRREIRDTLGASLNLPGLQNSLELAYRWDSAAVGVSHALSPSYTRINLWAEWVPVPPLALRAGVEPAAYFGASSALLHYDRYDEDFSENTRDTRQDEQAGLGGRGYVSPSLRFRAGHFVATSTGELEWWRCNSSGPLYYEPSRDTLLKADGDTLMTLTTVALFEREGSAGRKLTLGANHRWLRVFDAPQNESQRLGGIVMWTLGERRFGLRQPTLVVNGGIYLEDRFKEGEAFGTLAVRFMLGH